MRLSVSEAGAAVMVTAMAASAVIAPWPTIRNGFARLTGDTNVYLLGTGYEEWALRIIWCAAFLLLAVVIGAQVRWLGAAVALLGVNVLVRQQTGPEAVLIAIVIFGVVMIRAAPTSHPFLIAGLTGLALVQCAYVFLQAFGVDLLRGTAQMENLAVETWSTGTLGNRSHVGALLAMVTPLAVWWTLPVLLVGIAMTKSMGACLAVAVGLTVRWRRSRLAALPLLVAGVAMAYLASTRTSQASLWLRIEAAQYGIRDWLGHAPWFGHGLGGWFMRHPAWQVDHVAAGGAWIPAHNDPLQWVYEFGVPGAIVLGGFLISQRAMFRHRTAGAAVAALGVVSLFTFPFHFVTTALAGAILLGIATTPPTRSVTS